MIAIPPSQPPSAMLVSSVSGHGQTSAAVPGARKSSAPAAPRPPASTASPARSPAGMRRPLWWSAPGAASWSATSTAATGPISA